MSSLSEYPKDLIDVLLGKVWHATDHKNIPSILSKGIVPDAPGRWKSSRSRSLGEVSVFDFRNVDFERLENITEMNNDWTGWLSGSNGGRRCVVWMRLHECLYDRLISPKDVWDRHMEYLQRGDLKKNPIAKVEGSHEGVIPPDRIAEAVLIYLCDVRAFQRVSNLADLEDAIAAFLPMCPKELADPDQIKEDVRQFVESQKNEDPPEALVKVLAEARARIGRGRD